MDSIVQDRVSIPRCGKVTYKAANVVMFPTPRKTPAAEHFRSAARMMLTDGTFSGYVIVGWRPDMATCVHFHIGYGPVSETILPAIVHDVLLRKMIETGGPHLA